MTSDQSRSAETPEERAARVQAAKERAAAARAARDSGAPPPAEAVASAEAPGEELPTPSSAAVAAPPPDDDRPRTASGTLKRDPDAEKAGLPATPEERQARVEAARAAAAAARAAREAGGVTAAARPAAVAEPGAEEALVQDVAVPAEAGDGQLHTAKGTLKRDPDAPKTQPPATPEERAARIAAAKAAAVEAKEQAKSAPARPAAAAPAAAAARPAAGPSAAEQAAFRQAFEAVTRPVPGAEPVLKPVAAARAERAMARVECPITEPMQATIDAFRAALPGVEFVDVFATYTDPVLLVDRRDLLTIMQKAKADPSLDMKLLRCITGVDLMAEGIEVVYNLKSLTTKHGVEIRTKLPPGDPVVDSVASVWQAANWHERELMEMFGVRCAGHPDPRSLLLDDDMLIHPLLKAHPLADVELKQGVNVF